MLYLRSVTEADEMLLYVWANDPDVRKNSFQTQTIPYEVHQKWFRRVLEDESVLQFILMEDDTPVGQIRLNTEGEKAEIGYSVAADYRGLGYGHRILKLIVEKTRQEYPEIKKLVAKVKPDNIASMKLFQGEGFIMEYSCFTYEPACTGRPSD